MAQDFIWLSNSESFIPTELLKFINSKTFPELWRLFSRSNRDERFGEYKGHIRGRDYREQREYRHNNRMQVSYMFLTRVWNEALEEFLNTYSKNNKHKIDVLVINSALWDVTRWGPNGPEDYSENLRRLLDHLSECCPTTQVVFLTSTPCAPVISSKGMTVPGLEAHMLTTSHHVFRANQMAAAMFKEAGHMVIDLHFYLQLQTACRSVDGIHWGPTTHRLVTNLLLTHLVLGRRQELPGGPQGSQGFAMERLRGESHRLEELRREMMEVSPRQVQGELKEEQAFVSKYLRRMREKNGRQEEIPVSPSAREREYISKLAALYREHQDNPWVPQLATIGHYTFPHQYLDGSVDTIDEFLDTNHPLWIEEQKKVEAIVSENGTQAELTRKLAGLVTERWNRVSYAAKLDSFTNLSTNLTGLSEALIKEDFSKQVAELKNKLSKKSISFDKFSEEKNKLMTRKRKRNTQGEQPGKKVKKEKSSHESQTVKVFVQKAAENRLLSLIGDDNKQKLRALSSFRQALSFKKSYSKINEATVHSDSLFDLASIEHDFNVILTKYSSPFISSKLDTVKNNERLGSPQIIREEDQLQRKLAKLEEHLLKDGDIAKFKAEKAKMANGDLTD